MGFGEKIRGPMSTADRVAKHLAEHSKVDLPDCVDPNRRQKLEADPKAWLRYYLEAAFSRPFDKPHLAIIEGALHASEACGRFAIAAQRGIGKSTVLWGIVLMLALTGKQPFPVCVPWAAGALKRAFRFWKTALCFNERLFADYPEVCAPFRHSKGSSQKLAHTIWRHTDQPTGAQLAVGEGLIVLPDNRGCIGGATINGNPRGLNHPMPDGRVLRPTLALLDDVQDRGTAKSELQVRETIEVIDGDVAGMGEAGTNLPMLMSGNCIEPKDVMAYYLESDRWRAIRVPCVESWPDGWDDGKGETFDMWQTWHLKYRDDEKPTAYYRQHRAKMIKGMKLTAPGTFRKAKNVPDAYCAVMVNYFKMGHEAFAAEAQQKPIQQGVTLYNLNPQIIESRVVDRQPGEVPDWVVVKVAATDINASYGLTWAICGIGRDQSAAVLAYGIHKTHITNELTPAEWNARVYEALTAHGSNLASAPCRPDAWFIDAGGTAFDVVAQFGANSVRACGLAGIPSTGRGWRNYRPYGKSVVGTPREQCHMAMDQHKRRWVAFNADYWRERAQKAWTGSIGAPGSCSLPRGHHRDFAEQICREQLQGKGEVGGQMTWVWNTAPGPHDYGDAMTMCFMGAAFHSGIGTGGTNFRTPPRQKFKRNIRRVQV